MDAESCLLADVKNYLDITWDDPAGDKKLSGIIGRGKLFVQRLTMRRLGYEEGTAERELLFEYCLYARSGALLEFTKNYRDKIISFREDEAVRYVNTLREECKGSGDEQEG